MSTLILDYRRCGPVDKGTGYLSTFVGAGHICKPAAWPPGSTISGLSLPQEHLELVEKHFPTEEALTEYLGQKGIQSEKNTSG